MFKVLFSTNSLCNLEWSDIETDYLNWDEDDGDGFNDHNGDEEDGDGDEKDGGGDDGHLWDPSASMRPLPS